MKRFGICLLGLGVLGQVASASAADMKWRNSPTFASRQGLRFSVSYAIANLAPDSSGASMTLATPATFAATMKIAAGQNCPQRGQVVITNFLSYDYGGFHEYQAGGQTKDLELDLNRDSTCYYSAKLSSITLQRDFPGIPHTGRQEISVVLDGEWQEDPVAAGSHNFKATLPRQ